MRWDLFDRLVRFEDSTLSVDYGYDPLGRRIHKYSNAHHTHRPEAGSHWNQNERARKQRELGCGFTLFGWDGDTLAWESSPAQADGTAGKTVHYVYEPGTFVPVAQAMRHQPIRLLAQPNYEAAYDIDQDPLWTHTPQALPIDVLAWYQCDHLGTPQELTDPNGQIAWSAQYKAWGEIKEQCSEWAQREGLTNPISYAGGLNLYAYAPNPVGWVDPLGLSTIPKKGRYHGPKPKYENPGHHDPSSGNFRGGGSKHQFFLKMQSRCTKKQSRTLKVSTGMRWMKMELLTVLGTVMTETFIGMATHRRTVVSQYLLKSIKGSYQ